MPTKKPAARMAKNVVVIRSIMSASVGLLTRECQTRSAGSTTIASSSSIRAAHAAATSGPRR